MWPEISHASRATITEVDGNDIGEEATQNTIIY
jgi:hypothetical protein